MSSPCNMSFNVLFVLIPLSPSFTAPYTFSSRSSVQIFLAPTSLPWSLSKFLTHRSVWVVILLCSFNLVFPDSRFCIYLLTAYSTTTPLVQHYEPSSGGVTNSKGRGNELSSSGRRTVPSSAFKGLDTITKKFFNKDNRRHIRNSNQASPGYKTDVT